MSAVFGIASGKTPATLSDNELRLLVAEMARHQPIGYLEKLRHPDFIPVSEMEKQYREIIAVMKRRGIL